MEIAIAAFVQGFSLHAVVMLVCGVLLGLALGVIPGVGGMLGLVVLVPLTFSFDPFSALALLLGIAAVTTTSDTIPAVLVGIPGTAGAITTVVDGHPMAKNGEASRALGAAYLSSMVGGVLGACALLVSIPVMTPLLERMVSADFLAVSLFGLFFVATVSGQNLLKGLVAAAFGILVSLVGLDPVNGEERFVFNQISLWDGLPLAAVFMGVFALPELTALSRRKTVVGKVELGPDQTNMWQGFRDVVQNWWLVIKCSTIGSVLGAVPGVGVTVIDWVAYGIAQHSRKGGPKFGDGNVRGVIAPESANNAKEGGYLIPTIAFGLPGSVQMAILLTAFAIHGLVPGPEMLQENLPVTIAMVYYLVAANILGGLICLFFTDSLAKVARVPTQFIIPVALVMVTIGAFQISVTMDSVVILAVFFIIGLAMRGAGYSRPAFALGFVLGPSIERYFSIAYQINGFEFFTRPSLLVVLGFGSLLFYFRKKLGAENSPMARSDMGWKGERLVAAFFVIVGVICLREVFQLSGLSRVLIGGLGGVMVAASAFRILELSGAKQPAPAGAGANAAPFSTGMAVLIWVGMLTLGFYLIGHLAAVMLSVVGYLMWKGHRPGVVEIGVAAIATLVVWLVFDNLVPLPWPDPWLKTLSVG